MKISLRRFGESGASLFNVIYLDSHVYYTQISPGLCLFVVLGTTLQILNAQYLGTSCKTSCDSVVLIDYNLCKLRILSTHSLSSQSLEQPPESLLPKLQQDLARSFETQEQISKRYVARTLKIVIEICSSSSRRESL
jgi:hypothetical protein